MVEPLMIPTPRGLACGERRRYPIAREAWVRRRDSLRYFRANFVLQVDARLTVLGSAGAL
jgi:hypothetical protein